MKRIYYLIIILLCSSNLSWSATLNGTIYGGGLPLENATVALYVQGDSISTATFNTDQFGNYSFIIGDGTYYVKVTPPPASVFSYAIVNNIVVSGADVTQDVVLVHATATVSGVARDWSGRGVYGVTIRFNEQTSNTLAMQVVSDEFGAYSVSLSDGTYEVDVQYTYAASAPTCSRTL